MKYPDGERLKCWFCGHVFTFKPETKKKIKKIAIYCPECGRLLKTIV